MIMQKTWPVCYYSQYKYSGGGVLYIWNFNIIMHLVGIMCRQVAISSTI